MLRRPPRSTLMRSSAASDVYKRQGYVLSYYYIRYLRCSQCSFDSPLNNPRRTSPWSLLKLVIDTTIQNYHIRYIIWQTKAQIRSFIESYTCQRCWGWMFKLRSLPDLTKELRHPAHWLRCATLSGAFYGSYMDL
jgi:hypothetical protein